MLKAGLLFDNVRCDDAALWRQLDGYEPVDLRGWRAFEGELAERVRGLDVLITGKHSPRLPDALAADPGRLRYICHTRGVVKAYFPRALLERGVLLTNWGDWPARGVAAHAFALLVALLHQLPARDRLTRGGAGTLAWQDYPAQLEGLRVGVYGCGGIGARFASMCLASGCRVAAFDPWAATLPAGVTRADSLAGLAGASDALSIHCGLSDDTRGSVDATVLARLPRGGIVINTARGGIVDEAALAAACAAGRLLAGLDVVADERDWSASPLAAVPDALLTGHGRWTASRPADVPEPAWTLPEFAQANLRAFRLGHELRNRIDPAAYDRTT